MECPPRLRRNAMKFIEIFGRMSDLITRRPVLVKGDGSVVVNLNHIVFATREMDLAAASDYVANAVLSNSSGIAWTFEGVVGNNGDTGYITQATAHCSTTALTPRLTLFLFNAVPTCTLTDRGTNTAVLSADRFAYQGKIDFPALEDLGTGISETVATISTTGNLPLAFQCVSTKLYGVVVTRDAISGETAGMYLRIKLAVERH